MAKKDPQKSLDEWSKQEWTTASGKRSQDTGEVYAPKATIDRLKGTKKLARANAVKRKAQEEGDQYAEHGLHVGKER